MSDGRLRHDFRWLVTVFGVMLIVVVEAATHSRLLLLAITLPMLSRMAWLWIEERGVRLSETGISRPRLFRSPVVLRWPDVRRAHYRDGLLTVEADGQRIVLIHYWIRNLDEVLQFIRAKAPPSVVQL